MRKVKIKMYPLYLIKKKITKLLQNLKIIRFFTVKIVRSVDKEASVKSLTVLKIVASMKKLCIFNYTIASNNVSKDLVKIVMTNINHNHKILRSVRVCLSVSLSVYST